MQHHHPPPACQGHPELQQEWGCNGRCSAGRHLHIVRLRDCVRARFSLTTVLNEGYYLVDRSVKWCQCVKIISSPQKTVGPKGSYPSVMIMMIMMTIPFEGVSNDSVIKKSGPPCKVSNVTTAIVCSWCSATGGGGVTSLCYLIFQSILWFHLLLRPLKAWTAH